MNTALEAGAFPESFAVFFDVEPSTCFVPPPRGNVGIAKHILACHWPFKGHFAFWALNIKTVVTSQPSAHFVAKLSRACGRVEAPRSLCLWPSTQVHWPCPTTANSRGASAPTPRSPCSGRAYRAVQARIGAESSASHASLMPSASTRPGSACIMTTPTGRRATMVTLTARTTSAGKEPVKVCGSAGWAAASRLVEKCRGRFIWACLEVLRSLSAFGKQDTGGGGAGKEPERGCFRGKFSSSRKLAKSSPGEIHWCQQCSEDANGTEFCGQPNIRCCSVCTVSD